MYKSREDEYQRRYDANKTQPSYGYENSHPSYQEDVYDEDDFYGQIMKNASKNNPYRNIQPEPYQDYGNTYEPNYQEPRRSRMDAPSRSQRTEEDTYQRKSYQELDERPVSSFQKLPTTPYSENAYPHPEFPTQPEFKQPVRGYERTTQIQKATNDYGNTGNYNIGSVRETPSRRSRLQEEMKPSRDMQMNSYPPEEPISARRRIRPEEPQPNSYGSFGKELTEKPKTPPMTLSEEYESQRKSKRSAQVKKPPKFVTKKVTAHATDHYKEFVKQNLIIFVYALVNAIAFSLIVASILYTQVIQNYIMQSGINNELIKYCLILAPIIAYQVAGFHCGYTMLKRKFQTMKPVVKFVLSPILFIIYEVVGIVCEIPYLIYALVKMGEE